jgi:hypothetical protein
MRLPNDCWQPRPPIGRPVPLAGRRLVHAALTTATPSFPGLVETFPGNLASFAQEGLMYDDDGAHLVISEAATGIRPYRSGAVASARFFEHGRFEAEIRAASGSGLVTGSFPIETHHDRRSMSNWPATTRDACWSTSISTPVTTA